MSFKEKSVWIMAVITALAYAYYVSAIGAGGRCALC